MEQCPPRDFANYVEDQTWAVLLMSPHRLVELSVELENSVAAGNYWVYVFDYPYGSAADAATQGAVPRIAPKKINPGETIGWASPTKWTPLRSGLVVGISTSDETFTNANVQFGVYYHVVEGG